ncbi:MULTISPECIES: restriction endonuclease subunit S [unclassified Anabaena]|uniref:restriction endonuclease subunit S n=1 Tax=unclassified Anabaena TaxID=2619674 RepID=UPI0039C5B332
MSELPEGWNISSLGDICGASQYGWTTKAENQGSLKYLRTTDITKGKIDWDSVPYCQESPSDIEKYQIQKNDILISRSGSVGFSILIRDIPCSTVFASYLIRFIPSKNIEPRYVAHFLRSPKYWQQISNASTGIALANVNAKKLAELRVPVAPLKEQKRIADKLDALLTRVDGCRDRLERIPLILKSFRQAVLTAATSGQLTEDWQNTDRTNKMARWVSLEDFASSLSYGSSTKSSPSGSVPVLRMGNIQEGKLDWNNLVFTSDINEIEKYQLLAGDVLFNRTNSPELVGKTAVYKGERPAIYAGYLIRIRCRDDLLPDYLNYCLNSPAGRDYCRQVKSDAISQSNINARKLAAFQFKLPPVEEQAEIIRRTENLFAYADRVETHYKAAYAQVECLIPKLLAKAFCGELVPQDPNDEPASMLLERILAERAAQLTKPKIKAPKKSTMTQMTKESVREAIQQLPKEKFSFDELRENLTGDYDSLKDILFTLLSEAEPILTQVFDQEERAMRFFRAGK